MLCQFVGFLLDKKIGVNQPKRVEKAKILIANTPMDTDKIKVCSFKPCGGLLSVSCFSGLLMYSNAYGNCSGDGMGCVLRMHI